MSKTTIPGQHQNFTEALVYITWITSVASKDYLQSMLLNGASNYPAICLLNRATLQCRVNLESVILSKKSSLSATRTDLAVLGEKTKPDNTLLKMLHWIFPSSPSVFSLPYALPHFWSQNA